MRAVCTCRSFKVKVTASSQQPAKLAIFNCIRKRNACTAGPRVWPGRAGLTEARGAERRSKKLSPRLATAQQTGQRGKKTPADASSPRFITEQIHSTAQSKQKGNQNVHLLFAVAGELLSRGRKTS